MEDSVPPPTRLATDDDPTLDAASTYPLGVKLAVSDEATGRVAVTGSHVYRPWFFELEDLRKRVRAAIKAEAEARVRPRRRRSERTASCWRRPVVSSPHCTPIFKKTRTWASTQWATAKGWSVRCTTMEMTAQDKRKNGGYKN